MLGRDFMIRADNRPLKETPDVLNSVGVDIATHPFLSTMVDSFEKVPIGEIFKGIIPFFIGDLICLTILLAFPGFVLFLPNLMK